MTRRGTTRTQAPHRTRRHAALAAQPALLLLAIAACGTGDRAPRSPDYGPAPTRSEAEQLAATELKDTTPSGAVSLGRLWLGWWYESPPFGEPVHYAWVVRADCGQAPVPEDPGAPGGHWIFIRDGDVVGHVAPEDVVAMPSGSVFGVFQNPHEYASR